MTTIKFVILNSSTGAYIHESLFRIKTFCSQKGAEWFISERNLNPWIYKVKHIKEKII